MAGRRKTAAKVNIPICLAGILFCLTLFSFHLSSGVVARYSATSSGSDSARVIEFGKLTLTKTGGDSQFIYPGATLNWNAEVTFGGSESATYVFLAVKPDLEEDETLDDWGINVSDGKFNVKKLAAVNWTLAEEWKLLPDVDKSYVYYLELPAEVKETTQKLFEEDSIVIPTTVTDGDLKAMSSISAQFNAYAVQSNGFDSVKDAWESVSKH